MKKITIVLLLLLVTVGVFGTTYYVSVDGDDQNPGTQEEPFEHIQHAIDVAEDGDGVQHITTGGRGAGFKMIYK